MTEPASYKDTLNLPKTHFDMKANLITREPAMLKQWQEAGLYKQIRARAHPKGKWVLHDGPPYANGDIHMGHLINKVLKDIVVKFRTMQGHDSPYVPGWDCHGLPIESAIQKELGPKFRELSKEELRNKCEAYAMKFVKLQGDSFQRLGILGEFEKPYLTLDPKYEAGILEVLAALVERDLVYRQKKPVHWCVNDRTALAEAELEYAEKKDTSVYVKFRVANVKGCWYEPATERPMHDFVLSEDADLIIWTTTPWTLPANRAVAVNPTATYAVVNYVGPAGKTHQAIVVRERVEAVMRLAGIESYFVQAIATGKVLAEYAPYLTYRHPLDPSRIQPVVLAEYVTLEDGTGLVHTAPGHGTEDYQTGKRNNLEVYNPVLGDGRYDDTVPEFLRGKTIWESNALVVEKLKELGTLFFAQEFDHSYPHCWRCKKPVIFRATEQWFVKASRGELAQGGNPGPSHAPQESGSAAKNGSSDEAAQGPAFPGGASPLWTNAVGFVNEVEFIPAWGKNRLMGMLDTRPDWCISRQRSWGVPIPAFFDEHGKCLLTEKSVRAVAAYFKVHGATSWYTDSPEKILGLSANDATHGLQSMGFPAGTDVSKLTKGADILDVWFESGASHHAVLEGTHPELGYPANMYLEGSDQHRGWFQSSLLEAAGYKKEPPFKQLLTHGFVVDENGKKISKSSKNYVPLDVLLKQHGADVMRLWVASIDYQNDIRFSTDLLTTIGEAYRKIRNTMRYLLGNIYDLNPEITSEYNDPLPHSIDAWMHARVAALRAEVTASYDNYEFHKVFRLIYEFCNVDVSAIYAKAIKDRLYCELPDDPRRRRSQWVCSLALEALIELAAPILVFTADEAFSALRNLPGSLHIDNSIHVRLLRETPWVTKTGINPFTKETVEFTRSWKSAPVHWGILMPLVDKGLKQLDDLKKTIGLGNALDAEAVIVVPTLEDGVSQHIAEYGPEIEDALGVGFHRIEHGEIWDIKINDTREKYASCARSWKRRPDVGSDAAYPDLSKRDAAVVRKLRT